ARFAGLPREAASRVERARELLLRDDTRSLVHATALFTEAARIASGEAMQEAERGFAIPLQAAAFQDLAGRLDKDSTGTVTREAEPQLLRAQVELAGISADKQEPATAREALAKVLQDNPSHDRAKRMLALLPNTPR